MRSVGLVRLVLMFVAPLIVAAAVATGYAQRPSEAEAAFQAYLWLGGSPADLCGGHAAGHQHCDGCQASPPALQPAAHLQRPGPVILAAAGETPREAPAIEARRDAASPRGPPGWANA